MSEFQVGDRVRAKEAVYEPADDYSPGGYLCAKGDLLIVRRVTTQRDGRTLHVSHESITDNTFSVMPSEVEKESPHG